MTLQSATETITVDGGAIVEQLRRRIRESNVQQVVIKQGLRPIAAFPAIGGVLSAAVQSAIGALAIALADCTIEIERSTPESPFIEHDPELPAFQWIGVAPLPEGVH
ncbi:MAG: DUF4342 domain-containing protein [Chloroflexi bacterium]|nr:DUF4342 domain-containing protein [Chloroflexota bacterium]